MVQQTCKNGKNGGNGANGTSRKRADTCQRIIEAIYEANGLLTLAAKRAGVGYRTIVRYVDEFPSVQQAVYDAKESMIDFAESKLHSAIEDGNMTAIIFYLKTQAKQRGFIERQEVTGGDGGPLELKHHHDFRSMPDEALDKLITQGEKLLDECGINS